MRIDGDGTPREYLGDGVYASFDGYHVWLTTQDHRNTPLVALEPEVIRALNKFSYDVQEHYRRERESNS